MRRLSFAFLIVGLLTANHATAQVKLDRKYVPGSSSTTNIETSTHQILTLAGQDIETKSTRFIITTAKVGARKDDGTLPISSQIDKFQTDDSFPGGIKLQFDSGDPNKKAENPLLEPLLDIFRVVARTKTTTILDKDNTIKSVEFEGNPAETVGEAFKSQFDAEKRKKAANRELANLPDKPVKTGDVWMRTSESDLGGGQTLTLEMRYEYTGTEEKSGKTLDKISAKATDVRYAMDQNANSPLKITDSELKITKSEGTIYFDRAKGAVVEATSKVRIEGTLKASVNGMELPGKLDLTIESKTAVQP